MKTIFILISIFTLNCSIAQVSDFKAIDFTIADNIANRHKNFSLDNLPLLAHNLTHKLTTDAEKFRAIYTWVCTNIKGDIGQDNRVSKKRKKLKDDSLAYTKWNNNYLKTALKTLVKRKKTMCTGYAYLIRELCFLADIESKIINGYGRSTTTNIDSLDLANHSWNAVKLNNKWYLCDATWSSGYFVNSIFVNDYNLGYFLTEPKLFAKNHYPLDKKWLLDDTLIQSKFMASPIVYAETFKQNVLPISPKKLQTTNKKDEALSFSFKVLETKPINKVTLIQFSGNNVKTFKINNLKNENGLITFTCLFDHKGFYDVHLKIDGDIVATYVIKVI